MRWSPGPVYLDERTSLGRCDTCIDALFPNRYNELESIPNKAEAHDFSPPGMAERVCGLRASRPHKADR